MTDFISPDARRLSLFSCALSAALAVGGQSVAEVSADRSKNVTLLGIPSATVAPGGLVFGSISGATLRTGAGDGLDGSMALGFGLGSAEDGIGLQITSHLTSLKNSFADSGYFEIKAARRIIGGTTPTYVGLTLTGAGFGDAKQRETAARVAFTSLRRVQFAPGGPNYPLMWTLGIGSNERNNETDPGVFGGIGIGLTENLGVSAAWSGEYVNIGAAMRFDQLKNVSVSATLLDAFDQEDSRRIGVTFTYFLQDLF